MATYIQGLGDYYFNSSGSDTPDRNISFIRNGDDPQSIYATYCALNGERIANISHIRGNLINVELNSTNQKVMDLMPRRGKEAFQELEDKPLSEFSPEQQRDILSNLSNPWKIRFTTGIGKDPRYEIIESMSLFIPS